VQARQTLRFSFVRGWAFALRVPASHKSYYTQSRPGTGTRSAGPPAPGPRRLPQFRRPGSLSITASCGQRAAPCHAHCERWPFPPASGSARASSQASLHATRPHSAPCSVTRGSKTGLQRPARATVCPARAQNPCHGQSRRQGWPAPSSGAEFHRTAFAQILPVPIYRTHTAQPHKTARHLLHTLSHKFQITLAFSGTFV